MAYPNALELLRTDLLSKRMSCVGIASGQIWQIVWREGVSVKEGIKQRRRRVVRRRCDECLRHGLKLCRVIGIKIIGYRGSV